MLARVMTAINTISDIERNNKPFKEVKELK
jgi:hypothetical protein